MKCSECEKEVEPLSGGVFRAVNPEGCDLGMGSAPAPTKCRDCRMKEYLKSTQGEPNA